MHVVYMPPQTDRPPCPIKGVPHTYTFYCLRIKSLTPVNK